MFSRSHNPDNDLAEKKSEDLEDKRELQIEAARAAPASCEIGVGTTGFGIFFILFGMLLYFDSVLLAFGNLLFLTGLSLIIGLRRTFSFFFQRHKFKGTSFFLGGVVIVLLRWPLLGMCLETYGFFSLFRGFFPVAFGFLGSASNIPFLSALFQRLQGTSSMV